MENDLMEAAAIHLASPLTNNTTIAPIEVVDDDSSQQNNYLPLFKPDKIRVKEYWDIISLVAPNKESKRWKTNDAIAAYCIKCKIKIPYSTENPKHVKRHMNKYHEHFLNKRKATHEVPEVKTLHHFYSKKIKMDLLNAPKSDQIKGEALLVNWVATSLRPFTIVEDKGFLEFVDFLCNLNKKFIVPGRIKLRNQLVLFGELARLKMKNKIKADAKYFSLTSDIWSSRTMESFMAITFHAISDNFDMMNMTLDVKPLTGRHTGIFIARQIREAFVEWGMCLYLLILY